MDKQVKRYKSFKNRGLNEKRRDLNKTRKSSARPFSTEDCTRRVADAWATTADWTLTNPRAAGVADMWDLRVSVCGKIFEKGRAGLGDRTRVRAPKIVRANCASHFISFRYVTVLCTCISYTSLRTVSLTRSNPSHSFSIRRQELRARATRWSDLQRGGALDGGERQAVFYETKREGEGAFGT